MVKTRGAHSFRPRVRQGPTPPAGTSTPGPSTATTGPSATGPSATSPSAAVVPSAAAAGAALACLLCAPLLPLLPLPQQLYRALFLLMLRVPLLWPLYLGDIILGWGPLHSLLHIPGQPGGLHLPRGPRLQAHGSHPHRDLGRHPHHLIRVLPEPQTYLRHPSSGGLTSPTTPYRGMLITEIEISIGKCTTISLHLSQTWSSETPCS